MSISDADKVKALREICNVGVIEAKQAILYCQDHPEANEVGYVMAKGAAVYMRCTAEERIERFSQGAKSHSCYKRWEKFLETGIVPKE